MKGIGMGAAVGAKDIGVGAAGMQSAGVSVAAVGTGVAAVGIGTARLRMDRIAAALVRTAWIGVARRSV